MGLASKLAAAAPYPGAAPGAPPMGGAPPQYYPGQAPTAGYPVQQPGYPMQQQPGYPMQQQPGYTMQQQPGYPMQQQPGYPMPQQPGYPMQQPPAGVNITPQMLTEKLQSIVTANQLQKFYPPAKLQEVVARILQTVNLNDVAARWWRLAPQQVLDLCSLALYDVIIYADDSGSMAFAEEGERIEDLKLITAKVSEVAALFDSDGIQVRFINSDAQGNGVKNAADASALISKLEFKYDTKLARNLKDKVLKPIVYKAVDKGTFAKPVLVITITDGEPSDTPKDKVKQTIHKARKYVSKYGPKAVAFQFAQVGNDQLAQQFLAELDNDPKVGSSIDCTSNYELEAAEQARKGVIMTVESWLVKLMCGAIDPAYDRHD